MTLQKYTDTLPKDRQLKLAIQLTRLTLPIWDNYANTNPLTYRDTVVGLTHTVDKKILKDTIDAVERYLNSNKIEQIINGTKELKEISGQFDDPIVALQDTDWELPDEVKKTFYAVYNLIETLLGKEKTVFDESTIYVSINQAIDALETSKSITSGDINKILDDIKNGR